MLVTNSSYLERFNSYLINLDLSMVANLANHIINQHNQNKKIFIIGNGGSASTANHMAADLFSLERLIDYKSQVMSLSTNDSIVTQVGNDDEFENIFVRQLRSFACKGDIVIVISASGNSRNLIQAVDFANSNDIKTFGLLGFDGGALKNIVKEYILVKSKIGDYGPVEDIHLMINHMVKEEIINRLNRQ